MCER
jgi:hypothetical protein